MKLALAAVAALALAPAAAVAQPAAATAEGVGQVKAVDAKAGTITLHHGPIAALGWPAMTMSFKAAPDVLKAAKPGQAVKFTLRTPDNEVVALQPQ